MKFRGEKGSALVTLLKGITSMINVKWKIIILKASWELHRITMKKAVLENSLVEHEKNKLKKGEENQVRTILNLKKSKFLN